MGVRAAIQWNKLGLRLQRAKKAIKEGKVDWKKSLWAGLKAIGRLALGVAGTAVLGVLSDPKAVKLALENASVDQAVVALSVTVITGLAGAGLNAWKHRK